VVSTGPLCVPLAATAHQRQPPVHGADRVAIAGMPEARITSFSAATSLLRVELALRSDVAPGGRLDPAPTFSTTRSGQEVGRMAHSDVTWRGHIERSRRSQPNGRDLQTGQFPKFHPMAPGIGGSQNRLAPM
jgi:hypothetical protein